MSQNHDITINAAAALTREYRDNNPNQIKGGFFERDAFDEILAQDDCIGIRYYYGLSTDGTPKLILVGVDSNGDDMINGPLMEMSSPCPHMCGNDNVLNGNI